MKQDDSASQLRRLAEQQQRRQEQLRKATNDLLQQQSRELLRRKSELNRRAVNAAPAMKVPPVPQLSNRTLGQGLSASASQSHAPPDQYSAQSTSKLAFSQRPVLVGVVALAVSVPLFAVLNLLPFWKIIFPLIVTIVAVGISALRRSHLRSTPMPTTPIAQQAPRASAPPPDAGSAYSKLTPRQALTWAKQLYANRQFSACGYLLDQLLLVKSVRQQALYYMGLLNLAQKRDVCAAGNFLQANAENPQDVNSLYYLGRICELQGDRLSAARMYAGALAIAPSHRSALARIAHL